MDLTTDPGVQPQDLADAKLKDVLFMKRMTAVLCPGLYEKANRKASQNIVAACSALCDESPDLLSKVLQSRFIANHSPFYWALTGVEDVSKADAVPPLLSYLLRACGELSVETQEEILEALYKIDNDSLYQLLEPSLPYIANNDAAVEPSFQHSVATVKAITNQGGAQIAFSIPQFFDKLLIEREIVLPTCLANGSLWSLKAEMVLNSSSSGPTWQFVLTEARTKRPWHPMGYNEPPTQLRRDLSVEIYQPGSKGCLHLSGTSRSKSLEKTPEVTRMRIDVTHTALASFHGNSYLGPNRTLSGLVVIRDSNSIAAKNQKLKGDGKGLFGKNKPVGI